MNLAFLNIFEENRRDTELKPLLDIGTCGLQIFHNSFEHGE